MVIKLHKSVAIHACLNYVIGKLDIGDNRIIMSQNLPDEDNPIDAIKAEFHRRDIANIRSKRVSFHASINPTEEELEKIDIQELCKEYMTRMGYGEQPYIVVEHNDTGRKHFHIVSHRIGPDGKKINSSNEIVRTNIYVKELNRRLRQDISRTASREDIVHIFNPDKGEKRKQILDIWVHACSYRYANNMELNAILNSYGVEMIEKDEKLYAVGIKVGKRVTRAVRVDSNLVKPLSRKILLSKKKERLSNLVKFAMSVSLSEQHARNILARRDIGMTLLRNEQGRIYGAYIIDHKNRIVMKASDVSKDIAANQWDKLQSEKWEKVTISKSSFTKTYSCLNWTYAGDFMYNYWENGNMAYKDMSYTRKREQGRRMTK